MAAKGEIPALPLDDLELAAAVSTSLVPWTPPRSERQARSENPGAPGPPPVSRRRMSWKTPCWMVPAFVPAPNLLAWAAVHAPNDILGVHPRSLSPPMQTRSRE